MYKSLLLFVFNFRQTMDTFTVPIAEQTLIACFTFTQLNTFTLGSCPVLPQSSTVGH